MKPVFHRIHPLTIVIELPRALRQLFVIILIVAVQIFQSCLLYTSRRG